MFCPAFVCLSVCFCLLATSQKTTDRSFTKIYQIYLYLDKEELTKSWKKSASGSGSRNFKGFFNIAGGHFFTICLIFMGARHRQEGGGALAQSGNVIKCLCIRLVA